jgi:hypothetical protein
MLSLKKLRLKMKKLIYTILGFLMFSGLLMNTVGAAWPNLPSTTVQLTVVDDTTSYFDSTLSGVGAGFDVMNGVYPGWCVDRTVTMERGVSHNVKLYSSVPPTVLTGINWNAINYILNHKQGDIMDVQNAIWYFTDSYTPAGGFSTAAQAMIDDAEDNPTYEPTIGDVLAVICLPQDDEPVAQNSIIELTIPPREPGYTPGFWKHNIGVAIGENRGKYSAFEDTGIKVTEAMLIGFAADVGVSLPEAYAALTAKGGPPNNMIRADMANAFNDAAGYGPFED